MTIVVVVTYYWIYIRVNAYILNIYYECVYQLIYTCQYEIILILNDVLENLGLILMQVLKATRRLINNLMQKKTNDSYQKNCGVHLLFLKLKVHFYWSKCNGQ